MQPLVVGSIGFDMVFQIHGKIRDKISVQAGKIDKLDMLFTAKSLSRRYGGTAGNIAYGLAKLSHCPLMFGVVGEDYTYDYRDHLISLGVDDRSIVVPDKYTAAYYAISDDDKELIAVWQPNIHADQSRYHLAETIDDWKDIAVAIFSPGTAESIVAHMKETQTNAPNAARIFDPGPIINFFPSDLLANATSMANIVIGNEVEIPILLEKLKKTIPKLLNEGVQYIIETMGEKGVKIYSPNGEKFIPAVKATKFVEATGAGDAFRAGLISGMLAGQNVFEAAELGARMGSLNVATYGGQSYDINNLDIIS